MKTPVVSIFFAKLWSWASFVAFRWETPFTPCTGITAVVKQERRHFAGRGIYLAPWCHAMVEAAAALARGDVVRVPEADFDIEIFGAKMRIGVLVAEKVGLAPTYYLWPMHDQKAFCGVKTSYDTPHAKRDTLVFACAAEGFLAHAPRSVWIWAADWQTVPAMARLHERHVTCLHLHNLYDEYLGDVAEKEGYDAAWFFKDRSVLRAGFDAADVVAAVSRGFAHGVTSEILHTQIFAPHLQEVAHRIQAVENANFVELPKDFEALRVQLAENPGAGQAQLESLKRVARAGLPKEIQAACRSKTLIVCMGRAASQKLHCAVVEAAELLLRENPEFPALWVFATSGGDRDDEIRQDVIAGLCRRYPGNAIAYTTRIEFFGNLMRAADLNVMASLWEPFGGAYEGIVLPNGRGVDGLCQISAYEPIGVARTFNDRWNLNKPRTGWLFREEEQPSATDDLKMLLSSAIPSTQNATYRGIIAACASATKAAVELHQKQPVKFAELVRNALDIQAARSWKNYDEMVRLAQEALSRRFP